MMRIYAGSGQAVRLQQHWKHENSFVRPRTCSGAPNGPIVTEYFHDLRAELASFLGRLARSLLLFGL